MSALFRKYSFFDSCFLLIVLVFGSCNPSPIAEPDVPGWYLGSRQVPGPLPPDSINPCPELISHLDVVYGQEDARAQTLDIFKPRLCRDQNVPLAVFVHGGAWRSGSKEGVLEKPEALMLLQLGFALAAINYRLAPESIFPAQIQDCKLAIRFLRANAGRYGINGNQIGIWGSSAGGHLVMLMAAADDDDGLEGLGLAEISSRVQATVNHFGVSDLSVAYMQFSEWVRDFLGCHETWCPDTARAASPVSYASSDDPAFLLIHGENDLTVPYHQAVIMAEKLLSLFVPCALVKVKNAGHGFAANPRNATISPSRNWIAFMTVGHLARFLEAGVWKDLNLDGRIDSKDKFELLARLGSQGVGPNGEPAPDNWNPLADLHPDGKIDLQDWNLFSESGD